MRPTPKSDAPIAFFLPSLGGGGAERAVLDAVRSLHAEGHAVDLVLAQQQGPYLREVPAGVRLVDLRASRTAASLLPLAQYLRRTQPRALFAALTHANVIATMSARLARWQGRLIVSQRDMLSHDWSALSPLRRRVQAILLARAYARADLVTTVSDGVADDFRDMIDIASARVCTLYNATASPQLLARAAEPLDDPWTTPGAPPLLLAAGRLTPHKDFPTLLRAFAASGVADRARLVILGEGPERQALESLRDDLGLQHAVRLPGFSDNPFAWMARAHAFVLSSRSEGLPNVLIQALTVGCPVISTDCPSGPHEILRGGRHGVLVPVGDAAALGAAIADAVARPRVVVSAEAVLPFTPSQVLRTLHRVFALESAA